MRFLFDALDSGDYTFHFPEESVHGSERLLNTSLNRVKLILEHARDEQMEREKYFEFILDSVDTGILVVDDERGLVLRHNRAALALLDMEAITHIKRIKDRLPAFSVRTSHTRSGANACASSPSATSRANWPIRNSTVGQNSYACSPMKS